MGQHGVLVVGALGRMGQHVRKAVQEHPELRVAGALEVSGHPELGSELAEGVTLTDDVTVALADCDTVIDFSVPVATLAIVAAAVEARVAYVTGTTGFSDEGKAELERAAEHIPLLHAPNFSTSVNVLVWLAREAASKLGAGYDAEIFELHHSVKRDAPSGTALRLAEAVAEGQQVALREHLVLERAGDTGARPPGAIGVQTLRGGDNPGEHTVMFIGRGERLELVHRSGTREHFAQGAARAAAWLADRPAGLYTVDQALGLGS